MPGKKASALNEKESSSKKGQVDAAPFSLVETIIGALIVLFLFGLAATLINVFLINQDYDATINNFNELITVLDKMKPSDNQFLSTTKTFHVGSDYILVGFSYKDEKTMSSVCRAENIVQARPLLCKDNACLCIYENVGGPFNRADFDNNIDSSNPVQCHKFDENIVFLAPSQNIEVFQGGGSGWRPNYYKATFSDGVISSVSYEFLVLYGDGCPGMLGDFDFTTENFGVKEMYIEKYKKGEESFVYLTLYSSDEKSAVQQRKKYMQEHYSNRK